MSVIQAVQTFYGGTYYRSRTEARWAVFMDVLGIPYQYEPEKFQLSTGRYIPDFLIAERGCRWGHDTAIYAEIKGAEPDQGQKDRFQEFRLLLDSQFRKELFGGVKDPPVRFNVLLTGSVKSHSPGLWVQCPFCGNISLQSDSSEWSFQSICGDEVREQFDIEDFYFPLDFKIDPSPSIVVASSMAMSARFESPDIQETVQTCRRSVMALHDDKVFCHPSMMRRFIQECVALSRDPQCPRFRRKSA